MKFAINLFLLSFYILASDQKVKDEEYFFRMVKEDQLEKKLKNSEVFKDCHSAGKTSGKTLQEQIQKTSDCLKGKVQSLDKGQAENMIQSLELGRTELYGDPNQKNLSDYLSKLVEKSLYGDAANKPGALDYLNQETFTLVYERVVGKALFFELADYCARKNIGPGNALTMKELTKTLQNADNTEKQIGICTQAIHNSCDLKTGYDSAGCLFNRRLVEFKRVMTQLKKDKEFWQDVKKNSNTSFELTSLDTSSKKQRTLGQISSDLTNISSSKLVDEGYQENQNVLTKQAADMHKECVKSPTDEKCKKYFNKGIGDSLGQYRLQRELELDLKIQALEDQDLGRLKETATHGNYFSKVELEKLLQGSEADLKNALKEKYEGEKKAVKDEIDKRIGEIGFSRQDALNDANSKITNIYEILKNKPEEIRAINFFSNAIVAAFKFKNDDAGKRRVFSGIDQELQDLKSKASNDDIKNAIKYLEGFKKSDRSAASIEENHFLAPEEIDQLLFP